MHVAHGWFLRNTDQFPVRLSSDGSRLSECGSALKRGGAGGEIISSRAANRVGSIAAFLHSEVLTSIGGGGHATAARASSTGSIRVECAGSWASHGRENDRAV